MTTATAPAATTSRSRFTALSLAEYRQFRRNRTLMFLGTAFPVGLPLLTFFVARKESAVDATMLSTAWELFALMALLFVQYYSVLSMVTTRRGEGVLKRLRTGEASDWQIQLAPAVPGAVLTVVGAAVVAAGIYGSGAPLPVNPLVMLLGLVAGLVLFTVLALATTAYTKNAEAAQVTSLPVMTVAMLGLSSIRTALPERFAEIADRTPFAAVADLVSLGATGRTPTGSDAVAPLDFGGVFGEIGAPLATLGAWTVVALVIAVRRFRWDERD